jgi:Txe/YoeB family toxin of Txe-Axe toxin-antitoxin module
VSSSTTLEELKKQLTTLIHGIDDIMSEAGTKKLPKSLKAANDLKSNLLSGAKSGLNETLITSYTQKLASLKTVFESEQKSAPSTGKEEPKPKFTVNDSKAEENTMQSAQDTKYKQWKKLILAGAHPKEAAEQIGDSHYETVTGGYTIRLSQEHRVFFTISGSAVTVKQIGGHYPKTKK